MNSYLTGYNSISALIDNVCLINNGRQGKIKRRTNI